MFVAMVGHIYMYGEVGDKVLADDVRKELDRNSSADEIVAHVFSVGGDVFEGYAIYNNFLNFRKSTGKKVTMVIEGLCASIMTLIVAAGDEIIMNTTGQFMIHNPQIGNLSGDATELRNVADQLDKIKGLLIDVYVKRTGLSKEELWDMYEKETWLTAKEAVSMKFIDREEVALKAVAKANTEKFNKTNMDKTALEKITSGFKNLMNALKRVTNLIETSLADGTAVVILAEPEEDVEGKSITYADGTPLSAGVHELANGDKLTVDEAGLITGVEAAGTTTDDKANPDDMKEVEELKNKVATLEAKLAEKVKAETTAKAEVTKFKNIVATLSKDIEDIKKTTVGDDKAPNRGRRPKFDNSADDFDPMSEEILNVLESRNLR